MIIQNTAKHWYSWYFHFCISSPNLLFYKDVVLTMNFKPIVRKSLFCIDILKKESKFHIPIILMIIVDQGFYFSLVVALHKKLSYEIFAKNWKHLIFGQLYDFHIEMSCSALSTNVVNKNIIHPCPELWHSARLGLIKKVKKLKKSGA